MPIHFFSTGKESASFWLDQLKSKKVFSDDMLLITNDIAYRFLEFSVAFVDKSKAELLDDMDCLSEQTGTHILFPGNDEILVDFYHFSHPAFFSSDQAELYNELLVFVIPRKKSVLEDEYARIAAEAFYVSRRDILETCADMRLCNHRFNYFRQMVSDYTSHLDRMVNYVRLDERVFDLSEVLHKRLSEAQLKYTSVELSWEDTVACIDNEPELRNEEERGYDSKKLEPAVVDLVYEKELEELEEEDKEEYENEEDTVQTIWKTFWHEESELIEDWIADIEKERAPIQKRIDTALSLATSLNDEAARLVDRSVNMVLYWLGIITLVFGLVTIYDKYLSQDTFGLPHEQGLEKTFLIVVPLVILFLFTMIRYGTLSRFMTRSIRFGWLYLVDILNRLFYSYGGWFIDKLPSIGYLKAGLIGKTWITWFEWKLVVLLDRHFYCIENVLSSDSKGGLERFEKEEKRALDIFSDIWFDLEDKHNLLRYIHAQKSLNSMSKQLGALRANVLTQLAFDFLWLEMPDTIPSISVFATFYLKAPTLIGTSIYYTSEDICNEEYLKEYFGKLAFMYDTTKSGGEILSDFQSSIHGLIRKKWNACPESKEDLWEIINSKSPIYKIYEDDDISQVISDLDFVDLREALSHLTLAKLKRKAVELNVKRG